MKGKHSERGSSMVETAIVLGAFLVLIFGIIDFSRAIPIISSAAPRVWARASRWYAARRVRIRVEPIRGRARSLLQTAAERFNNYASKSIRFTGLGQRLGDAVVDRCGPKRQSVSRMRRRQSVQHARMSGYGYRDVYVSLFRSVRFDDKPSDEQHITNGDLTIAWHTLWPSPTRSPAALHPTERARRWPPATGR